MRSPAARCRRFALAGVLLASVAACSSGGDGAPGATTTSGTSKTTAAVATSTTTATAATSESSTSPTAVTTAAANAAAAVQLRNDGLGVTTFGDMPEYAVAALTAELGAPTGDATQPAASTFGACPGTTLRAVEWGGLAVLITDGTTTYGGPGGPHFFAYLYRSNDARKLATGEGTGLGSSVADLRAAYGTGLRVNPEQEGSGPSFEVGSYGAGGLYGLLDGTTDASKVTEIAAGEPCAE